MTKEKTGKSFIVSSKDLFDPKKNPKLSLSAKDIIANPKIKKKGWKNESARHALASKGIKTGQKTPPKAIPKPKYKQVESWIEGTHFKINDKITVVARSEKTRNGFKHVVDLYIDGDLVDSAKVNYLNRTWESYEYQTALKKLIEDTTHLSEEEKGQGMQFTKDRITVERKKVEEDFGRIGAIAKMGDIFGQTIKEKNVWKTRMLKAGLENKGLIMPEDWDTLDEKTKTERLDAVIGFLDKRKVKK